MDIFKLYRFFWDYSFKNPERIKPNDVAIYSFAIEHCNRLGWKKKFGFPTSMVMEATGIKSYSVYKKHFDNLSHLGFFTVIELSKNQFSSNIIALKENYKANDKALDKALIKHNAKQSESTSESKCSIDKQYNKEQLNQLTKNHIEVKKFLQTLTSTPTLTIEDRIKSFKLKVWDKAQGTKYENKEELANFSDYWCEHGDNDKKMKFEKQNSFGITRRLGTWFKNKDNFSNRNPKQTTSVPVGDFTGCENGLTTI